ncbi:hypothetical protein ACFQ1I_18370 [Kitasatospora arboriphila]
MLFAALLVFALAACRSLLGTGDLSGGALLPASDGLAGLWSTYAAPGTPSAPAPPPPPRPTWPCSPSSPGCCSAAPTWRSP